MGKLFKGRQYSREDINKGKTVILYVPVTSVEMTLFRLIFDEIGQKFA